MNLGFEMTKPVIAKISDNETALARFEKEIDSGNRELLLNYPTVYVHALAASQRYEVYIGETNNIVQRTKQHFEEQTNAKSWQARFIGKNNSYVYVIGHEHFNKSLTLDIENRLMSYMLAAPNVVTIYNKRGNEQRKYYPEEELMPIFDSIWRGLNRLDPLLFPKRREIEDSAIFKASPFHKLTAQQMEAKDHIVELIKKALYSQAIGELVFIEGEAGTGKTVLNSNVFYELSQLYSYGSSTTEEGHPLKCFLLVNHEQQLVVYQQIAHKLGIDRGGEVVCKPTSFINNHSESDPVDVIFVDEGHLLWTQGKQSYRGKNQLEDLRKRAKVVVVMFDEMQTLHTQEYWSAGQVAAMREYAKNNSYYYRLTNQLRIRGSEETKNWILSFIHDNKVLKIPHDENYEIRVFDSPEVLHRAIKEKAELKEAKLSRLIATFDWEYTDKRKRDDGTDWMVTIGDWSLPWNLQLPVPRCERGLAWAEQDHTINEVGSTFTIQGFDLNYAGVILGESITFRNGKIVIDPSKCKDKKACQNRTLEDGRKKAFAEQFVRNALNVLMTRGVDGLYIYAVDEELRNELKHARGNDKE